jgi:redox-sensing transcriptional repressor
VDQRISGSSVQRLSRYYRSLQAAAREGREHISSSELAERNGVSSSQVRKDLSHYGNFGRRGLGYPVEGLREALAGILGLDRTWQVALVGVGNIGSALLNYPEFRRQGFHISVAFDVDPAKVGRSRAGVPIYSLDRLRREVRRTGAEIGILAVPATSAQDVCDRMVAAGLRAILNFAPVNLDAPEGVTVRNEDVAIELETLSHLLTRSAPRESDRSS